MADLPTLRWGIVGTGMISEWFATDIIKPNWPQKRSYQEVYDDPDVDCVYIGTPHSFHRQNCLDVIAARKNILCEKSFCLTANEAVEVFAAAKKADVFIMEAMWTRFYPLMSKLQDLLFKEHKIGRIYRTFCDFGLDLDIGSLPQGSRYKDPALGAGSLLDIGVYSLTWGILTLTDRVGDNAVDPDVQSTQTLEHGVDVASSVILRYPGDGRQAICTSTTNVPSKLNFCRIEGSKGTIKVHGPAPSAPEGFTFLPKDGGPPEHFDFEKPGRGFFWEAGSVAADIKAGPKENAVMPHAETMPLLRIMDGVRQRGNAKFPVDDWE
ncbi:Putative gfo/Idh/MocA-like oxidoreductase, NAD(P)-binding domain superfamily [Septoria linicola]|uniref:D-xylose 1-dehydrogenase (NADP(+), D-xylono-1,5-lactone-forming) n=1 Tax=Septoria linicola TaxID=215465 RepID=A0A9Q9AWM3_9PEZI|nr:putative gfo/Idh/MocA-like oxidoreductase, NAD(P)-binding domain superfamily [Septoria linicola]USW53181.1 Putative gfo/Idh/MocA-like oxidoreductase, NAD(P)-binding domain superfamily [Septoria linicola]